MFVSAFELYKVGIGPSSSHTVGPMRAAKRFVERLQQQQVLSQVHYLQVSLHGSLAHTGKGHGTDKAIVLGLEGASPDTVDVDYAHQRFQEIQQDNQLNIHQGPAIKFRMQHDLKFNRRSILKLHSNGMHFQAFDEHKTLLDQRSYFSIGGGFIVNQEGEPEKQTSKSLDETANAVDSLDAGGLGLLTQKERNIPYPFNYASELLQACKDSGLSMSSLMWVNESTLKPRQQVFDDLLDIWNVMQACIDKGCHSEGILPGGLKVKRRAASLYRKLKAQRHHEQDFMQVLDWVNLWALAVNEENAAGGRVVTAPTNGAAGIIPAVLSYYIHYVPNADDEGIVRFFLTSAAIGGLYKKNASISGAEVGCQGEVGVACSMAAAALAEVMGGTAEQVCNAAEIGMEHNLGLTCDPWGGLVQVPCIERNAMGAVKAINAARIALQGDGTHKVSLDKVIETMRRTGADMSSKYKETARGGLALTVIEC